MPRERSAARHLRAQVPDPELRRKLTPDYALGCKRILISNDYYPALAQAERRARHRGVAEVREHTVVAADGTEREVDAIIFGTGFHVTDMPIAERVRARRPAARRALGRQPAGAPRHDRPASPNFFMLRGPNIGTGHMSVVFMAEAQSRYVLEAIPEMDRSGIGAVERQARGQRRYNARGPAPHEGHGLDRGRLRQSWYIDSNGLNTSLWPDFAYRFKRELRRFDLHDYEAQPCFQPAVTG